MSLQMIYGRSGRGKTEKLFEFLRKSVHENNSIRKKRIIIVPDQFSYTMEKKLLEKLGETSVFNVSVMGFSMLAKKILEDAGGIRKKIISPIGRTMIISDILRNNKDELKLYKDTSAFRGFTDLSGSAISEFKNYEITPEILREKSEKLEDSELKYKLLDLALIYEEYENELHRDYIDGEDKMKVAIEKFREASFLKDAEFYIDEFSDFTPSQLKLISIMIKYHNTFITLTMDEKVGGRDYQGVFLLPHHTDEDLIKIASMNNVEIRKPIYVKEAGRFKEAEDLSHIEKNFYSYPGEVYSKYPENVRIIKAQNPYEEIEFVVRDIMKRVREEGLRFKDMAILTRNVEDYESTVKSLMEEYGIPQFTDLRKNVDTNPLSSLISAFFEIYESNFSHDAVFRYLKSGLTRLNEEEIFILENYVLQHGLKNHRWKDSYWKYDAGEYKDEDKSIRDLNIINEAREDFIIPIVETFDKLEKAENVREMATLFYNFLKEENILKVFEGWIRKFEDNNQELFRAYSQTEDTIMDVLDEMVNTLGEKKLNIKEFAKTLGQGISAVEISLIPTTLDQVIVGDISRIRSIGVKGIYIVGTNDGMLPRTPETRAVLNDEDRAVLDTIGLKISKNARIRAFYEQFYVYNALTSASSFLTVSYPGSDVEGNSLRPSMVIGRLKKIFGLLEEENSKSIHLRKEEEDSPVTKTSAFRDLIGEMRRHYDGGKANPIWKEIYHYFKNDEEYKERLRIAEEGIRFSNNPRDLKSEHMQDLFGKDLYLTVSRAEKYNSCPFSYFVEYGLKARERKEFKINTPDVGVLMHRVIDDFTTQVQKNSLKWEDVTGKYIEENVEVLMNRAIEEDSNSIFRSSKQMKHISGKIKKLVTLSLEVVKEQILRGEFNPLYSEMDFKEGGIMDPLVMNLYDDRKVMVSGRVDRLDILKDGDMEFLRVIDYKSGNKAMDLSKVFAGVDLQLLIYLDVVLKNQEKILGNKAIPGGAFYATLNIPEIRNNKEFEEREFVLEILKKMKLSGLLLEDYGVATSMDENLKEKGKSDILYAKVTKDKEVQGSSSQNDSMVVTKEDFEVLRKYARNMIKKMAMELIKGNIAIVPIKDKTGPACRFCSYKEICQFDSNMKGNEFRNITGLTSLEAMERIRKEVEEVLKDGSLD